MLTSASRCLTSSYPSLSLYHDTKLQLRPKNQPHLNILKRTCFHPGVSGTVITDITLHQHLIVNRNGERLSWSSTRQKGDRDRHDEGREVSFIKIGSIQVLVLPGHGSLHLA